MLDGIFFYHGYVMVMVMVHWIVNNDTGQGTSYGVNTAIHPWNTANPQTVAAHHCHHSSPYAVQFCYICHCMVVGA